MRYVIAFGRFLFDVLVGDRPTLLVGPAVALTLVTVATGLGWSTLSGLLPFGLVIASGGLSFAPELAAARAGSHR
jgi:hypothetical protein